MNLFFIGIVILFLSGIISALFCDRLKTKTLTFLTCIGSLLCLIPAVKVLIEQKTIFKSFDWFNNIFGTVNFAIDFLSAFFIIVISIMTFLCVVYSNGYLKPYIEKSKSISSHLVFLPVLIASMLLVVTCHNALMFLVCWEIMSLSSFFLVIFENEKKEVRQAGIKYLIFMHISVLFIMLAFAILNIKTGSFGFDTFRQALVENSKLANLVFIFAFIGFGTKAGFVPFHNWLPAAHPQAPSHVSAMMSGVMIKTGIYGILRILSFIDTPSKTIAFGILLLSLITELYGVLYAITQHDIKKLLAYHSIENIGIIGIGIGVGMVGMAYNSEILALLGFAGALLHVLNHSIFKELLFLSAGSVYLKAHTKDIESLGGLIKAMPYTAILFLIGSVAICGLPPLNGFVSEVLIYLGMFQGLTLDSFVAVIVMLIAIGGLALVGTMAVLCFTKAFSIIFLGNPRTENAEHVKEDSGLSMILPMTILGVFCFAIGLIPHYMFLIISNIAYGTFTLDKTHVNDSFFMTAELINTMWIISIIALILIVVITGLIILKHFVLKNKTEKHSTWGCGYDRANNHMQYTASSYASPFLAMVKPLFKKVLDLERPYQIFPKSAHLSMHIEDIEEAYIINPLIKSDEKFLSKFESLQSGNIQSYIKYGLIFLAVVVIIGLFIG